MDHRKDGGQGILQKVWDIAIWAASAGVSFGQYVVRYILGPHGLALLCFLHLGHGVAHAFSGTRAGEPVNIGYPTDDSFDWGDVVNDNFRMLRSSYNTTASNLGTSTAAIRTELDTLATTYVNVVGDTMTGTLYSSVTSTFSVVLSSGLQTNQGVSAAFFAGVVNGADIRSATVGNGQLASDSASLSKVSAGAATSDGSDITITRDLYITRNTVMPANSAGWLGLLAGTSFIGDNGYFVLRSTNSIAMILDSGATSSSRVFGVYTNATTVSPASTLFEVDEGGDSFLQGSSPSLEFRDNTASAKDLMIHVDGNVANIRESAGASGSLIALDLSNNRVGIGTASPCSTCTLHVNGSVAVNSTIEALTFSGSGSGLTALAAASIASGSLGSAVICSSGAITMIENIRLIEQISKSAAYTTVMSDQGKHILHPIADNNARTFTIDSNANVAYPIGTAITFINLINTVTIAITSDTMYLAGTGSTGSRTLAAYGVATAVKVSATVWIISGTGLT